MKTLNFPDGKEEVSINGVILTHKDIFNVVDDFYARVQMDSALKIPFNSVQDWPHHIEHITHFWWTRFGGRSYLFNYYNPVPKHFFSGFNRELLSRWLSIFDSVLVDKLNADQRNIWKVISEKMGESLFFKNELFKREYLSQQD